MVAEVIGGRKVRIYSLKFTLFSHEVGLANDFLGEIVYTPSHLGNRHENYTLLT